VLRRLIPAQNNTKDISAALSTLLEQDANVLVSILDPQAPPASKNLGVRVEELQTAIAAARSRTAESRLKLTQEATRLHELYREIVETSIRILEQTIHGSVARGTKAKADYLACVTEGMNKKLGVQHGQLMSQLYSPEIQEALQIRHDKLDADLKVTKRKIREAEQQLEDYRSTGGMENLAREYAQIVSEIKRVEAEVARLKNGGNAKALR
jgi:F0F1-type ATP synthase membrane subunit b/b'